MADEKKDSLWKRIRFKYRLSILREDTLHECWHIRLSGLGAFTIVMLLFLLTIALFSLVIIYTPIRNVLPGYSENIRQGLIIESARLDSLESSMQLQMNYLNVIKQVMAGEVQSDTVISLDSMQILAQEELLLAKSEATQEFIAQYESKEKDNLALFDIQPNEITYTFFRPAHGIIIDAYVPNQGKYGISLQTVAHENVASVLAGSVIMIDLEINNTYTVLIQHLNYVSVYKHLGKVTKSIGTTVQAGETIGLIAKDKPLYFELWQNGNSLNPEDIIAF